MALMRLAAATTSEHYHRTQHHLQKISTAYQTKGEAYTTLLLLATQFDRMAP